jgi:hypothetical protein
VNRSLRTIRARGCKNLQKIAEKTQRFAEFCKKLQKKYASLHNFSPSVSLLIDQKACFHPKIAKIAHKKAAI